MMMHKIPSYVDYDLINQPKLNKSPQSCLGNEYENLIIKLWGQVNYKNIVPFHPT